MASAAAWIGEPSQVQEQKLETPEGEGRNRTGDTTVFSRVLYQLSYLARASPVRLDPAQEGLARRSSSARTASSSRATRSSRPDCFGSADSGSGAASPSRWP